MVAEGGVLACRIVDVGEQRLGPSGRAEYPTAAAVAGASPAVGRVAENGGDPPVSLDLSGGTSFFCQNSAVAEQGGGRFVDVRGLQRVGEHDLGDELGSGCSGEHSRQLDQAFSDAQVREGVRPWEELEREQVARQCRGNLRRAGLPALVEGCLACLVDNGQRIGAAAAGRVEGGHLRRGVPKRSSEPSPQDLVDETDLAPDDLAGRVVDAGLQSGGGVVGGEEVLVEVEPRLSARVGARAQLLRQHCRHEAFDGRDLAGDLLDDGRVVQDGPERGREHRRGGLQGVLGLPQRDDPVAVAVGPAAQRGDGERVGDDLRDVVADAGGVP